MGPGMDADLVPSHILIDEDIRVLGHSGANDEECRVHLLLREKFEEISAKIKVSAISPETRQKRTGL